MDIRDDLTWVVLELTPQGEARVDDGTLEKCIRVDLGIGPDFPVFVPAVTITKGHRTTTICLIEGYAFVASGLADIQYLKLEERPYINQVMSVRTGPHKLRTLSVVKNAHVEDLKRQLRDILGTTVEIGDHIRVFDGTYRGLEGIVQGKDLESAFVLINLRSMNIIATIPLAFIENVAEDESSLEIGIKKNAIKMGFIMWPAYQDNAVKEFLNGQDHTDIWFGGKCFARRFVDWKRRRISIGPKQTTTISSTKAVFVLTKRPDGSIGLSCR